MSREKRVANVLRVLLDTKDWMTTASMRQMLNTRDVLHPELALLKNMGLIEERTVPRPGAPMSFQYRVLPGQLAKAAEEVTRVLGVSPADKNE